VRPVRRLSPILLLLLNACVSWQAVSGVPLGDIPPRQEYRLTVRGHSYRLHALRVLADSVSGVPYLQPPSCDSCRITFAVADIERTQLQHEAQIRLTLLLLAAAVGTAVVLGASTQ
jgi:hypothetical protein